MNKPNKRWSSKSKQLAVELHADLAISSTNWHRYKSDSQRRCAELLAGALVQLISEGEEAEISLLINQALLWINKEIKDPGCPNH